MPKRDRAEYMRNYRSGKAMDLRKKRAATKATERRLWLTDEEFRKVCEMLDRNQLERILG